MRSSACITSHWPSRCWAAARRPADGGGPPNRPQGGPGQRKKTPGALRLNLKARSGGDFCPLSYQRDRTGSRRPAPAQRSRSRHLRPRASRRSSTLQGGAIRVWRATSTSGIATCQSRSSRTSRSWRSPFATRSATQLPPHGGAHWYSDPTVVLDDRSTRQLSSAWASLPDSVKRRAQDPDVPGRLVAQCMFGFWTNLLDAGGTSASHRAASPPTTMRSGTPL